MSPSPSQLSGHFLLELKKQTAFPKEGKIFIFVPLSLLLHWVFMVVFFNAKYHCEHGSAPSIFTKSTSYHNEGLSLTQVYYLIKQDSHLICLVLCFSAAYSYKQITLITTNHWWPYCTVYWEILNSGRPILQSWDIHYFISFIKRLNYYDW